MPSTPPRSPDLAGSENRSRFGGKFLPSDARTHNRALVLQHLFTGGPMSRADIARSSGLAATTMTRIVADLIADGYVRELTYRADGGIGRPAVLLELETALHKVIAVDLSGDDMRVRGALATLTGELSNRRELADQGTTQEEFVERLAQFCEALAGSSDADILGVGIAAPGVIDAEGTIYQAAVRGWQDFPLARLLTRRLGMPVYVANDAYSSMQAELTLGHANENGSIFVTITAGVGSGVAIDGSVVRGAENAPGEIGHVRVIDEGGLLCNCGSHGCLETMLSAPALRRRMAAGDADDALRTAGRTLGTALAPIVSALNIVDIIVGGPADLITDTLKGQTLATIQERTLPALSQHLIVRSSTLGDDVALGGAAVLVVSGELGVS